MRAATIGPLALLATCLLISSVSTGPLAGYTGQENVYSYKVTVGKESESQLHQGFLIAMNVVVRRRSDNTYNIRVTDVDVRCHRNNSIPKEKYSELETNLKVPFEYDPSVEEGLKIYAPDTIETESSNLKRGLVNVLEFYDSEGKKMVKLSGAKGSTGSCAAIENPQVNPDANVVELNKFSNLESNCSSGYQHVVVKKRDVSNTGTFCETETKISRNVAYHITRSKDGQDPVLKVTSRERIQMHSLYPQGMFDGVTATLNLQLVEVRAQTPDNWTPSGSPTTSCTEVNLARWKQKETQESLLAQAKEGFKMLEHCLHKLDTDTHLEDHDVTTVLLQLTKTIRHLNKDSLNALYESLEGQSKSASFFQILGLTSTADSFKVVSEIFNQALSDGTNAYSVGQNLASYFQRLDHRNAGHMDMKTVKEIVKFWESIKDNAQVSEGLKNSAILAASALTFEKCIRRAGQPANPNAAPADPDCPTAERVWNKLSEADPEMTSEDVTLLKIKLISNMELKQGVSILKSVISDKTKPTFLRTAASWSLSRVARRNADLVKDFALKTFFDRTEDHEVRIAAYLAVARSASTNELTSVVQHVIDNNENEDRQVVSYVISSISALRNLRAPDGSKCKNFMQRSRDIYESIVAKVENKLGPRDVFDSAVYHVASHDNRESVLLSIVA